MLAMSKPEDREKMKMMQVVVFVAGIILVSAAAARAASEDVLDRYGHKIPLGRAGPGFIVRAIDTHTGLVNFNFWLGITRDSDDGEGFPNGSDAAGENDTSEMSNDPDMVDVGKSDTFASDDAEEIEDVAVLRTNTPVVMSMNFYPSHVYACRGGVMGLVPILAPQGTPQDAWIRVKRVEGSVPHLYYLHITKTPNVGVQFKPLPTFTPTALYCSASEKPTIVQFELLRRPQAPAYNGPMSLS